MDDIDLVIFDCDGVLVDSEVIAARVEADLITKAGYPISAAEISETYAGLTFRDILLRVEKEADMPFQATLIEQARTEMERELRRSVQAIEGVHEAVAAVETKRCICSNSRSDMLDMMLTKTGIKPLFGADIFAALETPTAKPKPAPDVFLFAAEKMKADPRRTFAIEDSVHGIHGAKAAGMRVIGFTGGSHSYPGHGDLLMEAGAETVIRRWAELKGVLGALASWSEIA
ncbi:HAD family hydrolase [Arvimicrobium flavum]|uniref:HAD family hydrolase n=1 Tax=Arvimicrobium flavum TaxID=3393320 RepID=UPI00237AAFAB|nr:HAD family phosphatase [Mesorhizobium shangrilense]